MKLSKKITATAAATALASAALLTLSLIHI